MKKKTQIGFRVSIEIVCETEQEILTHLSVIRAAVKKQLKKDGDEFLKDKIFEDSNCYGEHTAIIRLDYK